MKYFLSDKSDLFIRFFFTLINKIPVTWSEWKSLNYEFKSSKKV